MLGYFMKNSHPRFRPCTPSTSPSLLSGRRFARSLKSIAMFNRWRQLMCCCSRAVLSFRLVSQFFSIYCLLHLSGCVRYRGKHERAQGGDVVLALCCLLPIHPFIWQNRFVLIRQQETLNYWKQLSHVMKYFRPEEDPGARLPPNFITGFLEGRNWLFHLRLFLLLLLRDWMHRRIHAMIEDVMYILSG